VLAVDRTVDRARDRQQLLLGRPQLCDRVPYLLATEEGEQALAGLEAALVLAAGQLDGVLARQSAKRALGLIEALVGPGDDLGPSGLPGLGDLLAKLRRAALRTRLTALVELLALGTGEMIKLGLSLPDAVRPGPGLAVDLLALGGGGVALLPRLVKAGTGGGGSIPFFGNPPPTGPRPRGRTAIRAPSRRRPCAGSSPSSERFGEVKFMAAPARRGAVRPRSRSGSWR
jgi:hypothetical protein